MLTNEKIFIGMGERSGHLLVGKELNNDCKLELMWKLLRFNGANEFNLGVYKGKDGVLYIEDIELIPYNTKALNNVCSLYKNEEAFYVGKITHLVEKGKMHYNNWEDTTLKCLDCSELKPLEGKTFRVLNGKMYEVVVQEGRLVLCH